MPHYQKAGDKMENKYIRERITQLRMEKGVSEYQMSLDLGQSKGYIQSISSGRTLPSMAQFLNICEYFSITPMDFFNPEMENPRTQNEVIKRLEELGTEDRDRVIKLMEVVLSFKTDHSRR